MNTVNPEVSDFDAPQATTYGVGVGIADITGEAGGVGMMGYALPQQRTAGIQMRQWARAFIIANEQNQVVFVNTDTGMIFISVKQEVLRRLRAKFGDRYSEANTILSATHNHSGPGGYSHYTLYNITTAGFRPKTFEATVSGIVLAIERADADVAPGTVTVNSGDLFGANVNRSYLAFARNPESERMRFPHAVDPSMTVLRLERNGSPVGVLSWFATHGTSVTNNNRLISADNKGYAAYLWEHQWAGRSSLAKAQGDRGFVAGFAQGNAGDMSPNLGAGTGIGPAANNYFANARVIGTRQAIKAHELFESASEPLSGPIDCRARWVDFSHVELDPQYVHGTATRTWPAIVGQGFTGGTVDGHGLSFIKSGSLKRHPMFKVLDAAIVRAPADVIAGHSPQPPALATGLCQPIPWTPPVLPLQVVRIGQLAIVAGPGEFTITSGHRIRSSVAAAMGGSVTRVVFAGYANAYSGYITTPEEYSAQLYEGGSTHFGPATLPAYQQEFAKLGAAITSGSPTPSDVEPPDLRDRVWSVDPLRRLYDSPGRRHGFGDVVRGPDACYGPDDMVEVTFHSANPSNDTRNGSTFLEVQHQDNGQWLTVATDDDWETAFKWRRHSPTTSRATIRWHIPSSAVAGTYRIVHNGTARMSDGEHVEFTGATHPFEVSATPE
ncbi:MAG: neutral/alkaline non-lysosomal ceramidase N-terminal domain-containing protein [Actinomycetes bacterium]